MSKNIQCLITIIIISLTFLSLTQIVSAEKDDVVLEFFYMDNCSSCNNTKPLINEIENIYNKSITIKRLKVVKGNENYSYLKNYSFETLPAVVVLNQTNQTLFAYEQINKENIENTIYLYLYGELPKQKVVIVEYFYRETCDSCNETKTVIDKIEEIYGDKIILKRYLADLGSFPKNYEKMKSYGITYPAVVILNTSNGKYDILNYDEIMDKNPSAVENIGKIIEYHLIGDYAKKSPETQIFLKSSGTKIELANVIFIIIILLIIAIFLIILKGRKEKM